MTKAAAIPFQPRKTPRQARSTATVEAIMQATIQVLLKEGKSKLTTTRIAGRAGVSVGTLYQYFPNKNSLLQELLKEHLGNVALAVETACEAVRGASLARMAEAVVSAFVQAKFRNIDASVVLYSVSGDLEGKRIAYEMHTRVIKAMTAMFQSAQEKTMTKPDVVAATLWGAMAGVSRAMLETKVTRHSTAAIEKELIVMARAYLQASAENIPATPVQI